jgi:hypothetical protein
MLRFQTTIVALALAASACAGADTDSQAVDAPVTCLSPDGASLCFVEHEGVAVYQGDVILGTVDEVKTRIATSSAAGAALGPMATRGAFLGGAGLWGRTIPYAFGAIGARDQGYALEAFAEYEQALGFQFVPRTTEADYIVVVPTSMPGVCRSVLGHVGGPQDLQMVVGSKTNPGCLVHELGHALGLLHEQSRPDRDENVIVHLENVQNTADARAQFAIDPGADISTTPYDVGSVMHYYAKAFSANGRPTITRLDGSTTGLEFKTHLSPVDVAALGTRYAEVLAAPQSAAVDVIARGGRYAPQPPVRVADSRIGLGFPARLAAGSVSVLDPALSAGKTALVFDVAVTQPEGPGFLTVYPCDRPKPLASNLNFRAGQTIANLVTVAASPAGTCFYAHTNTDIVVDLNGGYVPNVGDGYTPVAPSRLLDTRSGIGGRTGMLVAGEVFPLTVAGVAGVAANASSVMLNVAVTEPTAPGFVTVFPCGVATPVVSNVNYAAGETIANSAEVKVGANGQVCFYSMSTTHVVVDVNGATASTSNGSYTSVTPLRLVDSRSGLARRGPIASGRSFALQVGGANGVPANATSAVLNLAVTNTSGPGFVTVYPCDVPRPNASNVNYVGAMTIAGHTITKLSADGKVCFYAHATTDLVVDLGGYFVP